MPRHPILLILLPLTLWAAGCGEKGETGPGQADGYDAGSYDPPLAPSVDGAQVSLAGLPERATPVAAGFPLRVSFRNIPEGSGLHVLIVRNVERQGDYPASGGTLTLQELPVEGSGSIEIPFAGTAVSAPADALDFFPIDPGEYRLIATIRHPRIAYAPMRAPPPQRILAQFTAPPVRLTGPPQTGLSSPLTRAFLDRLVAQFGLDNGPWDLGDYYATGAVEIGARSLCIPYAMRPPFAGVVRACVPASLHSEKGLRNPGRDQVELRGEIRLRPGVVAYRDARAGAIRALESRPWLGRRPPERSPDRPAYVHQWVYRPQERAWLFKVVRMSAGPVFDGDHATVRVADGGGTTLVEHLPGMAHRFPR
jgi:hypothetical protein